MNTPHCTRCGGTGREPDWKKVGRAIRRTRKADGIGVRELARMVDCSPASIVSMEKGAWAGGIGGDKTRAVLTVLGLNAEDVT